MKSSVISLNGDLVCSLIILASVKIECIELLLYLPYRMHCMQKSVCTVESHVRFVKCWIGP